MMIMIDGKRFTPSMKHRLIRTILSNPKKRSGLLKSLRMSEEELILLIRRYGEYGIEGLKSTKLKSYRSVSS